VFRLALPLWLVNPPKSDSILHQACSEGVVSAVGKLLKAGAMPNEVNSRMDTPLHLAAQEGHAAIVKALIEAKANVKAINRLGETPVVLAARGHHVNVVKLIGKMSNEPVDNLLNEIEDRASNRCASPRLSEYDTMEKSVEESPPKRRKTSLSKYVKPVSVDENNSVGKSASSKQKASVGRRSMASAASSKQKASVGRRSLVSAKSAASSKQKASVGGRSQPSAKSAASSKQKASMKKVSADKVVKKSKSKK